MATFLQLYGDLLNREVSSSDTELFTTQRRKDAVNEGQREFVRLTQCLTRKSAAIVLSDGVGEYDLESVISAADFLDLTKDGVEIRKTSGSVVTWIAGEDQLPRRDIVWLNRNQPGWRSSSPGTPTAYYIDEDGGAVKLGLTPPPDITGSDTWDAFVPYVASPTDMSADGDEPFTVSGNAKKTLRQWHQALVHYAAAKMEELRKNYPQVDRQMQLFSAYATDYLRSKRRPGGTHVLLDRDYLRNPRGGSVPYADWWLR